MGIATTELLAFLDPDPDFVRTEWRGEIVGPAALDGVHHEAVLAFCDSDDAQAVERVRCSQARFILVPWRMIQSLGDQLLDRVVVGCVSPRTGFIRLVDRFWPESEDAESGRLSAVIHDSARVAADAIVESGVIIGAGTEIGPECVIHGGVKIYRGTRIGRRVRIDANAVIGSPGFGYERDADGRWLRFPQRAGVVIGDDVEIGAGSTIDRGALVDTVIGDGTKIDNLVYVAHNSIVGRNCLIMAASVVAGSCEIGDGAVISPGACIRDKCLVGEGAHVGIGAVVVSNVPAGKVVMGVPAKVVRSGNYEG